MRIVCIFLVFHSPIQLLSEEYCEVCELRDQLRECRARLGAAGRGGVHKCRYTVPRQNTNTAKY